jgi:hypothetical protein
MVYFSLLDDYLSRPGQRMVRLSKRCIALVALIACLTAFTSHALAQTTQHHALWQVYFAAGADAAIDKKWPEAELLYNAAIQQAQSDAPVEPFLTLAEYSLVSVYWEEHREDDAEKLANQLKLSFDAALVTVEVRNASNLLSNLGNAFYNEATAESDAIKPETKGDELTKINGDITQKYFFARRYYRWATMIETKFLTPHSPELENDVAGLSLANYKAGQYEDAILSLLQLKEIVESSLQRDNALSSGSLAYSLASKSTANGAKNTLSIPAITLFMGLSYEAVATQFLKDKPDEAAKNYALGEHYLTQSESDPDVGKNIRTVLARIYDEHAQLLRQRKQQTEAEKLESQAKKVRARNS